MPSARAAAGTKRSSRTGTRGRVGGRRERGTGERGGRRQDAGQARALSISAFGGDAEYLDNEAAGGDGIAYSGRAESGVVVSTRTALQLSPVWRAVDLISTYVAKVPLCVYRRMDPNHPEAGKTRAYDHPAYGLLARKASPELLSLHLKKTLTAHALLTGKGNGYAYVKRLGSGVPQEIWILNPSRTFPVRYNGQLEYITFIGADEDEKGRIVGGEVRRLAPSDVIHIRGLGFDGLIGYDVLTYMRETIGLSTGLRKFGSIFFKNGAFAGTVLERPIEAPSLSPKAEGNLRRSFESIHKGLDNAHRTAVLQEGTKAHVLGVDARKAQLTEERLFQLREVAAFFGIPPHKLGDPTRTSYNSLEAENQAFLDDCIDYWLCQWEAEATDKLVSEEDKASGAVFVEALREAILRTDLNTQVNALATEVNNGLLNVDEARAIRNRPPLPDGLGQHFRMPGNMVLIQRPSAGGDDPAGDPDDEPDAVELDAGADAGTDAGTDAGDDPATADGGGVTSAARSVLQDAALRMVRRLVRQAQRATNRPDGPAAWEASAAAANRAVIADALSPGVALVRAVGMFAADADRGADILCRTLLDYLDSGGWERKMTAEGEAALAGAAVEAMLRKDESCD